MDVALALGRRGLGRVWPNPAVGCVIFDVDGVVAGRGWTQIGGRPHAEAVALDRAGERARGGVAYVSLEPCSHYGATPPCADALIAAGIARVVVCMEDPDDRVSGRGLARLAAAGVKVEIGLRSEQARYDQAGFFSRLEKGRPLIALKSAMTLDGRIATRTGDAKWITAAESRRIGHMLRATHDAILVGVGTAQADDPRLDCRISGLEAASPVRVVLDSNLRLNLDLDLTAGARARPTWVVCGPEADPSKRKALADLGVSIVEAPLDPDGRLDPAAVATILAARGITRLLIEGGGAVAASFLKADLVDRIHAFRAPFMLGGDGRPAAAALGLDRIADAPRFVRRTVAAADDDLAEVYVRVGA